MRPSEGKRIVKPRYLPLLAAAFALPAYAKPIPAWTTSWFAPMVWVTPSVSGQYEGQTIRSIVHLSVGGPSFRLRIANTFGTDSLGIGSVHVAVPGGQDRIDPRTDRVVTFAGRTAISIPLGATALSDPIEAAIPGQVNLAVSLYLTQTSQLSDHQGANQVSYVAAGDMTGAPALPGAASIYDRPFLTGVDVVGTAASASVVTLGDSITDGNGSDFNANDRWPDDLAARLTAAYGNAVGVANAGIAGNAIISRPAPTNPVATARFDRDVLAQPGRRWVILLEGINDIGNTFCCGPSPSGPDLTAADRQIIAAAHAMGLKVYGMTVLPFKGAGYYTAAGEQKRQVLNQFIRTSGDFDAVFDTDAALRDPSEPDRLLPGYDSGDHLHPNAVGDQVIANTVDLSLFKPN
jgi:lysophospholipase L1-like esterase